MPTLFYTITDLNAGQCTSSQDFNVLSEENVSVVLVQWSFDDGGDLSPANLNYTLSGSSYNNTINVVGEYKSQSDTITFTNVPSGTYKLQICNEVTGENLAEGNGYIYY